MTGPAPYRMIDGVKCYHPEVAESYESYPSSGFEVTDEVETESFWVRSRLRVLRREILGLTDGARTCRLLEIGCGTGLLLRSLAGKASMELLGSEVYLRGLRSARARAPGIELIQLDATAIPFESEFDVIGAFDVIEHIDDDVAVLDGIHRALKPGGSAIITVPQHPFLWSRLDELVHHRRRYTRQTLVTRMRDAGLEITYVSSFFFTLFPLMLMSRFLDRDRSDESQEAALGRRVRFNPLVNRVLDAATRIDELLIRLRLSLPWGGSLLAIGRRVD